MTAAGVPGAPPDSAFSGAEAEPRQSSALVRDGKGRFIRGGGGKPVGTLNRRTRVAAALADALLAGDVAGTVVGLLKHPDPRIRLEAARTCLDFTTPKGGRGVEIEGQIFRIEVDFSGGSHGPVIDVEPIEVE